MVATATKDPKAPKIGQVQDCKSDEFTRPPYAIFPKQDGRPLAGRGVSLIIDGVPIALFSSTTSSGGEAETIDVTTHDTPGRYRRTRPGFASELTASFDILYDPTHPSHMWLGHLFQTGRTVPIVVQIWNGDLPAPGAEIMFDGHINSFPLPNFPIDGPYAMTIGIGGITRIRFPGMDVAPVKPAVEYAYGGCPGAFLPTREEGEETQLPTAAQMTPKIRAFPSSKWAADMHVTTSDAKDFSWDGTAWVAWTAPAPPVAATTAKSDGTFLPAGAEVPANLAALQKLTAQPTTAWTTGQKVTTKDGNDYHWAGSTDKWKPGAAA